MFVLLEAKISFCPQELNSLRAEEMDGLSAEESSLFMQRKFFFLLPVTPALGIQ